MYAPPDAEFQFAAEYMERVAPLPPAILLAFDVDRNPPPGSLLDRLWDKAISRRNAAFARGREIYRSLPQGD